MEKKIDFVISNGIVKNSQIKDKIYNELKQNEKIKEEIEVDNIPICVECILEDELGNYICSDCRINLCSNHVKEHSDKFQEHKYSYLFISDLI